MKQPARRVLISDIEPMPWKNGGGVTREVATGRRTDGGDGWGWRVSVADVAEDGPFSPFPGVDRVIAVIEGAGMDLVAADGTTIPLDLFRATPFSGDDRLIGRLRRGPVRDLNVMVLREQFAAEMDIRSGPRSASLQLGRADCAMVLGLAGHCRMQVDGGEPHDLAPGECLVYEGKGEALYALADGSRSAVIHITRWQEG